MLPFMQPKKIASIIMQKRSAAGPVTSEKPEDEQHPALMEHSRALIAGVHAKDETKVAEALKAAHEHLNSKHESKTEAP